MAPAKSGSRADRESLRAAMLAQGCGIDEIAAEMRARWGYALRAAYCHANGLTLDQAVDRCNTVANDADACTSGSRVSDWEAWPRSGRRPSAFTLLVLDKAYGTLPRRLISLDEWETLDERERLILDELGRANSDQQASSGGRGPAARAQRRCPGRRTPHEPARHGGAHRGGSPGFPRVRQLGRNLQRQRGHPGPPVLRNRQDRDQLRPRPPPPTVS